MAKATKKKTEILYIVSAVRQVHAVEVFGKEHDLDLIWADGMIGVLPVFDSEAAAEKYADGNFEILRFEVIKK